MENSASKREIKVTAQYIKDLSFENPHAPKSFGGGKDPATAVSVDINASRLKEELYEVELKISAKIDAGEEPLFLVDVTYAGLFEIYGVDQEEIEGVLLVYGPSLLFPFVRRIIADVVKDGGFPPLMLDPIDFAKLYMERRAAEGEEA